ncbi:MAG: glycosylase [Schumannella sp.]|nr:glycosylase [Schumannella sp.]
MELLPDPSRVVARLFLPGEGVTPKPSRAGAIVRRILDLPESRIAAEAAAILQEFGPRHPDLAAELTRHAQTVAFRTAVPPRMDDGFNVVLGAAFTAEHSVEAAALCNPSAFAHPDQSGLAEGELRLALALRSIGEGHVSSIGFASAIIGPGRAWRFAERAKPLVQATIGDGVWSRVHFRRALESEGRLNQLSSAVVRALPDEFVSSDIETAIAAAPAELTRRPEAHRDLELMRTLAWSAYSAVFDPDTRLSQRVLLPVTEGESNGIEDARFVPFVDEDGSVEFRASYTAYDGRSIAPRLLVSPDLVSFTTHRLVGSAAENKGMAFFPRAIDGTQWALTRTDGENISIARSPDGLSWHDVAVLHTPAELWEVIQLGNCGSPIETDRGWLVITHGVGPMRRYAIGALLLDLDDPTKVIARLTEPLLEPAGEYREGYVPNVVYSCGGVVHDGRLWLPYGVGDQRIRAATIDLAELLDAMVPSA